MKRLSILAIALAMGLAACPSPTAAPPPTPSASPTPPPPPPPPIAPLTGLEATSASVLARPVLAVKIDNHPAARPHVGLEKADIVYEEPVEGGLTRFMALFHSRDADPIGPIRSGRLIDIDILDDYPLPILAYSGAAAPVQAQLERADIVLARHGNNGAIYRRDRSRRAPHNLFSRTKDLRARGKGRAKTAKALFTFGDLPEPPPPAPPEPATPTASPSGSPDPSPSPSPSQPAWPSGKSVRIAFGRVTAAWKWNDLSRVYQRSHGSTAHRTVAGRVTTTNVLVLTLNPGPGGRKPNTLTGSGKAVLLRDGVRISGTWSRKSGRMVLRDKLGRPMVLAPGVTWVELVPKRLRARYA